MLKKKKADYQVFLGGVEKSTKKNYFTQMQLPATIRPLLIRTPSTLRWKVLNL
jgi:hypothetical protein